MTRRQFMDLLTPVDEAWSESHGDHEGGYPGNCPQCAIGALLETIGLLVGNVDWDEEGGAIDLSGLEPCVECGIISANHALDGHHEHVNPVTRAAGLELQRGLEVAVQREHERLDGPDDNSEEPGGQIGETNDF